MKFVTIALGCLSLGLVMTNQNASAQSAISPENVWRNSLKPKGKSAPTIQLAADGKTNYVILLPASPDAKEQRAADELAKWLHEGTQATFQIVKEAPGKTPRRYISVGRTAVLQSARLPQAEVKLNPEGLGIGQKEGNLFLFGGPRRGPLYAAIAFMEEDLGYRWYSPEFTRITSTKQLNVSVAPRIYNPPLVVERNLYYADAFGNPDWQIRNKLNSQRSEIPAELGGNMRYARGTRGEFFVHTFNQLVPKEQYFATHPEYYAERNGVRVSDGLCETNSEVQKIAVEAALETLKGDPLATDFNVSRLDGMPVCKCPVCKAVNDENGSDAASLILLTNAVADAVAQEYPHVKVSTIAYLDSLIPPSKVRPRDNVIIRICNDLHSWPYPLISFTEGKSEEAEKYRKAIQGWSAISKQLSVWDYTVNFDHYPAPMPNMHIVGPQLQYYIDHKVTGIMLQGDYNGPHSDRATMRMWVWAKQLWNPSLNVDELIKDFNYGYYGKAAAPIQEYEELLDAAGKPHHADRISIRYDMNTPFLTMDFIRKALALFERSEELAKGDAVLTKKIEIAKLPIQYVILSRRKDFTLAQYEAAFNEFSRVATANELAFLKEPPGPDLATKLAYFETKLRGRQAPKFPLPPSIAATVPVGKEAESVIDVHPAEFNLWFEYELVNKVDDPLASNGKAAQMVASTSQWATQYHFKDIDDLNGDNWRVYVVARVETKDGAPKTGEVLTTGIYDSELKREISTVKGTLEELGDGQYHVLDLGVKTLKNHQMVYVAPAQNANANYVFVDRIILVREAKKP